MSRSADAFSEQPCCDFVTGRYQWRQDKTPDERRNTWGKFTFNTSILHGTQPCSHFWAKQALGRGSHLQLEFGRMTVACRHHSCHGWQCKPHPPAFRFPTSCSWRCSIGRRSLIPEAPCISRPADACNNKLRCDSLGSACQGPQREILYIWEFGTSETAIDNLPLTDFIMITDEQNIDDTGQIHMQS